MTDSTSQMQQLEIFPAGHALRALRHSPYRNSAFALSELVDNSYDAGAENIHVAIICEEKNSKKPQYIVVLDDGRGMSAEKLQRSCQYGMGRDSDPETCNKNKLGRFGVGLVNATFNQCSSLQIWSWQHGHNINQDNSKTASYVSIDDRSDAISPSEEKQLPSFYEAIFADLNGKNPLTGTLVLWGRFHNLKWAKASTLAYNLAKECGRIYRNFISRNILQIKISIWDANIKKMDETIVEAVDPLFLTTWKDDRFLNIDGPMFEPWRLGGEKATNEDGTPHISSHVVKDEDGNNIGCYRIMASIRGANSELMKMAGDGDPGQLQPGKLAKELQGVSILREGRELMLDPKWLPPDMTIARWIGLSIDFDASLDAIFGVDNIKQNAHHLSDLATIPLRDSSEIKERANNESVAAIAMNIKQYIKTMHGIIKKQRQYSRKKEGLIPSFTNTTTDQLHLATAQSKHRYKSGDSTFSDDENPADNLDKLEKQVYAGGFVDGPNGEDVPAKKDRPNVILREGVKVDFIREPGGGGAFFSVREGQGVIAVVFNQDHPLFPKLESIGFQRDLNAEEPAEQYVTGQEVSDNQVSYYARLNDAKWLIKQLFFWYARAECEAKRHNNDEFESVRLAWGRVCKAVIDQDDE